MTTHTPAHRAHQSPQALLEADIERQRDELAQTVSDLQARLNVKARAQDKAHELKDRATTDTGKPRPAVAAGAVAGAGLVAGAVALEVRRRRHH